MSLDRSITREYRYLDMRVNRLLDRSRYQNADMTRPKDDLSTFGGRLRWARTRKNLTQKQLESRTGVSQSSIAGIETGGQAGSSYVARLALALGVTSLWLSEGRGPRLSGPSSVAERDAVEEFASEIEHWPFHDLHPTFKKLTKKEQGVVEKSVRTLIQSLADEKGAKTAAQGAKGQKREQS